MSKPISESSLMWMPKKIWGPIKWRELHCRALAYLPMQGEDGWFKSFIESIPCPNCQKHFELFINENPPNFESRPDFFKWTVDAHNYVNRSNCKEEISYERALALHSGIILNK